MISVSGAKAEWDTDILDTSRKTFRGHDAATSSDVVESKHQNVKQAQEELGKAREKFSNTLHLCTFFLSDDHCRSLLLVLTHVEEFLRQEYLCQIDMCQTVRGALEWHILQSKGRLGYLGDMLASLGNVAVLRRLGFDMHRDTSKLPELHIQQQFELADALMTLMRHMYSLEYFTQQLWAFRPPYCWLSSDPDVVEGGKTFARSLFDALEKAESQTVEGSWMSQFLDDLHCPRSTIVREILISLHECEYVVADDIRDILRGIFHSHPSSRIIAEAFKGLSDAGRHSASGNQNRLSRYETLVQSSLLEEYGQPSLGPPWGVGSSEKLIDEKDLKVTSVDFSLGAALSEAVREELRISHPMKAYHQTNSQK